jgi:hypothetical protein
MTIRDSLRAGLGPAVSSLLNEMGSSGFFRVRESVADSGDGSPQYSWITPLGGSDHTILLEVLTKTKAERIFGHDTRITVMGTMSTQSGFEPTNDMGLVVTVGFMAGKNWQVREVVQNDFGQMVEMGLEFTEETF